MADSTGPIIAAGAITLANLSIVNRKPVDWRIPVATAVGAGIFALAERGLGRPVVMAAWLALLSTLFVRTAPNVPTPAESFAKWWGDTSQPTGK